MAQIGSLRGESKASGSVMQFWEPAGPGTVAALGRTISWLTDAFLCGRKIGHRPLPSSLVRRKLWPSQGKHKSWINNPALTV